MLMMIKSNFIFLVLNLILFFLSKITMLIDYYTKKKNKNTNTMNKNLAKDLKNGKNFKQKGESNFKQPIIISQQIISNLNYNNNNIPMKSGE